jgi:hypothetical protein
VSAIVKATRGQRCEECGTEDAQLHVHHIVPLRKGGDSDPANLLVLCRRCHAKKHFSDLKLSALVLGSLLAALIALTLCKGLGLLPPS